MTIRVHICHDEPEAVTCMRVRVFDPSAASDGHAEFIGEHLVEPGNRITLHLHGGAAIVCDEIDRPDGTLI